MDVKTFIAIRHYLNLSQVEYARELGVANSTVSMTEAGHREISDRLLAKVAHLNVDMNEVREYIKRKNDLIN